MLQYTYHDFKVVLNLIDEFNKKHGKIKNGITYTQINNWLFDGYVNLITYVETDRKNKQNDIPEIRHDKDGLYGGMSITQIVTRLISEFQIDKDVFITESSFEIDLEVVRFLKQKHGQQEQSEQIVYLLGSTYQGKQLEVKSRSIFKLDLKSKKVTFEYYGPNNLEHSKPLEGKFSGDNLIYVSFLDGKSKKMYILKKGGIEWKDLVYINGTYIGDDGNFPMAGSIFCEKVTDLETAKSKLGQYVDTGIQYRLLYTQIRKREGAISKADLWQFSQHHFNVAAKEIDANFKGSYYGCYLSSQGFHSILMAKLEIHSDGSAIFYGTHNPEGERGWIYLSGDRKTLYLRFKFNEKLNLFNYFITLTHDGNRLYGSYGGGSNIPYLPETGRIILRKIEDKNAHEIPIGRIDLRDKPSLDQFLEEPRVGSFNMEAIKFLRGEPIINRENDFSDTPSKVFKKTQFDTPTESSKNLDPKHPDNTPIPEKYFGIYEGYVCQNFTNAPLHRIQRIAVNIMADKSVVAISENRKYTGQAVKYTKERKIGIHLAFEEDYPEIHHTLEAVHWDGFDKTLRGTYTGTGRTAQNVPIGGRIILFNKPEFQSTNDIQRRDFSLSNAADMQQLEQEIPNLLDYFLGLNDNMVEGYGSFKNSGFLPICNTPYTQIQNHVAGYYLSFRLRTDLRSIAISPLSIDDWGNVKMKSTRMKNNKSHKEYSGVCEINNNEKLLSLKFHLFDGKPFYALSKFNKSPDIVNLSTNKLLMGIFSSSNVIQERTFACKHILIFQGKNHDLYDNYSPEVVPVPIYPNKPTDGFIQKNQEYDGLLDYLIGDEYNMIRMGRGPRLKAIEKYKKFEKKINYGEIFYLAALQYYEMGKKNLAINSWKQAILNGFQDQVAMDELKEKNPEASLFFTELSSESSV